MGGYNFFVTWGNDVNWLPQTVSKAESHRRSDKRANDWSISSRHSLQWQIYIYFINSVDKTKSLFICILFTLHFLMLLFCKSFNLHLTLYTLANISMHLLHTVLYTFLKGLKRRSCLTVKSSLVVDHFPYSHDLNVWFRADIIRRN